MALVTESYYLGTYFGEPVATEDFPRYEARAEDLILTIIHLTAEDVAVLNQAAQTAVKKAICAQMDYFYEYGLGIATYGKTAAGFTVGKVSVNGGGSAGGSSTGAKSMICPAAILYLETAGLLNPAVATAGEPWPYGWGWI